MVQTRYLRLLVSEGKIQPALFPLENPPLFEGIFLEEILTESENNS